MKTLTTIAILVLMTISTAFGQSKKIDKGIVGTWAQQDMIASSGYGDYASYTSVTYYQFGADGSVCVSDGGSVSSGNDWSYNNNGANNAQCGKWYVLNGYIYFEQNGQPVRIYQIHISQRPTGIRRKGKLQIFISGNYKETTQ
jgi:hypothetical protein